MTNVCALFPGQGFQRFGMMASLAVSHIDIVKPILDECEMALPHLDMRRLLLGIGTETDVTRTDIAQPLLLANSIAHYRAFNQPVQFGMGHSLGEYSAFVCANLLTFKDALKLLNGRGEAMLNALNSTNVKTGMTLVMNSNPNWSQAVEHAAELNGVDVAAYNSPNSIVISGEKLKLKNTVEYLKTNFKRVVHKELDVNGAFHSKFMEPAKPKLLKLVTETNWLPFENAKCKVVSNLSANVYTSIDEIKRSCVLSLTNPVRWSQSVLNLRKANKDVEFVALGGNIDSLMKKYI